MVITTNAFEGGSKPFRIILDIRKSTADLRSLFQEIGNYWFDANRESIFSQRGGNKPFKDLKESTKITKRKKGRDPYPILVETKRLRDSLTKPKDRDAIFSIRKDTLVLGSKVPYVLYHMDGFKHRSGVWVSPRPPLSLKAGGLNKFLSRLSRETSFYFEGKLRKPVI